MRLVDIPISAVLPALLEIVGSRIVPKILNVVVRHISVIMAHMSALRPWPEKRLRD